jgi:hypothetical protein
MTSVANVGDFSGQTRDVAGLGVEELHPGVEMTHVGIGQVNERLDFRIDRADDVCGEQIENDDGTVLQERADDRLGRSISINPLELPVASW